MELPPAAAGEQGGGWSVPASLLPCLTRSISLLVPLTFIFDDDDDSCSLLHFAACAANIPALESGAASGLPGRFWAPWLLSCHAVPISRALVAGLPGFVTRILRFLPLPPVTISGLNWDVHHATA